MHPEVSIVIPTYNRRAMVAEAIASVIAQCGVNFDLIVVDDGSTDRTAEELDRLATLANADHAHRMIMRVVRTENRGVAAARNTGVALASAPLIAFLDSDDLWLPDKLERQMAFTHAHRNFAIAQTEEIWIRGGRRVNPGLRHRKRAGDIFVDSLRTCLISPSAAIMRIDLFRELGGFDERMTAAEDYDLWLRILARGHEVGLVAEPLVTRRAGHLGQLSATVPAIDRFRILALLKLLASDTLDASRKLAVGVVLVEKCAIYAQGLRRRGGEFDATAVAEIAERAKHSWNGWDGTSIDDAIVRVLSIISTEAGGTIAKASSTRSEAFAKIDDPSRALPEVSGATRPASNNAANASAVAHKTASVVSDASGQGAETEA